MVSTSDCACAVLLWQCDLCSPAFSTQRYACKGCRSISICSVVSTCSVLQLQARDHLYALLKKLLGSSDELPWVVITRLWLKLSTKQLFLWKERIVSLTCKPTAIKIGFWNYNNKSCLHAISLLSVPFPTCSACLLFLQHLSVRDWTDRWSFLTFRLPLSALGPTASLYLFMHLYLKGNRLYFNCTWRGW